MVTNNMRFLVLPWVRVAHLGSHIWGKIGRRIQEDWFVRYGHAVVLFETFVDTGRFRGTCYRAANWHYVGQTKRRSRNDRYNTLHVPVKDVYLYPLTSHFREILTDGHSSLSVLPRKAAADEPVEDEIASLKSRLKYRERNQQEGFLGSLTPSSQKPAKATTQEKTKKPRDAKQGHPGFGRKMLAVEDADCVEHMAARGEVCPFAAIPWKVRS